MYLLLKLAVTTLLTIKVRQPHIQHQTPQPTLPSPSLPSPLQTLPMPSEAPRHVPLLPPPPRPSPMPPQPEPTPPPPGIKILHSLEATLVDRLQLPANSRLQRAAKVTTVRKTVKVKLRQQIGAALVYGSNIVAEMDAEEKYLHDMGAEGLVTNDTHVSVGPRLSRKQALRIVATAANISDEDMANAWNKQALLILYNCSHDSLFAQNGSHGPAPVRNGSLNLTDFVFGNNRSSDVPLAHDRCPYKTPVLSYLVSFYVHPNGSSKPLSPHAVVSAVNGMVLALWNGLSTATVTKIMAGVGGNTGRWGLQNYNDLQASVDAVSGRCQYDDASVQVQNLKGAISGAFVPWSFDCGMAASQTYDATNGGYAPMNDAALYARVTIDMYRNYVNDKPVRDLPLRVRVHYGQNYDNAFWDGTQVNVGDGGTANFPLVSLGLMAHEISHGYTSRVSGLRTSGQSGCINEAFSDMAAEAAKFYRYGANTFVFGRNVVKVGGGMRWLCDPTSDGTSIDNAAKYTANMDSHRCSGVYNKAFCLLAKTAGWGTDGAFQVFADANKYMSELTNMSNGVCCVQTAATDIGASATDVAAAFAAVGLSCSGQCPPRA